MNLKLSRALVLAALVLPLAGLFVVGAVFRFVEPEMFAWATRLMSHETAFFGVILLAVAAGAAGLASRAVRVGADSRAVGYLLLALAAGGGFLAVFGAERQALESRGLIGGHFFDPAPEFVAARFGVDLPEDAGSAGPSEPEIALEPGDAAAGAGLYLSTCMACHGMNAEGVPGLGPGMRENAFVSGLDDRAFVEFLKVGRAADDPANTTGIPMMPRGGNPALTDQDLAHIVAHIRTLEDAGGAAPPPAATGGRRSHASVLPSSAAGPAGLAATPGPDDVPRTPAHASRFFRFHWVVTGLLALFTVLAMATLLRTLARALAGHTAPRDDTVVRLCGACWGVMAAGWLVLFPLFYLH
ncbi:MAG: cytochrome c [Gemmatimonadota bacterium]|nr:cytochrome c [Gemmatimonadota bacterium]